MSASLGFGRLPSIAQTTAALTALAAASTGYPETALRVGASHLTVHQPRPEQARDLVRGLHNPTVERRDRNGTTYYRFAGDLFVGGVWPVVIVVDRGDVTDALAAWVDEVVSG